jgi:hypothetical protein
VLGEALANHVSVESAKLGSRPCTRLVLAASSPRYPSILLRLGRSTANVKFGVEGERSKASTLPASNTMVREMLLSRYATVGTG